MNKSKETFLCEKRSLFAFSGKFQIGKDFLASLRSKIADLHKIKDLWLNNFYWKV